METIIGLEKNLHATIVNQFARMLIKKNKEVVIEPKVRTNGDSYIPDIAVVKRKKVMEIYEVETESTINSHSVVQWKKYASGNADFILVVPESRIGEAKKLLKENKIKVASIWSFKL